MSVGKDMEKLEPSYPTSGNTADSSLENTLAIPQKGKNKVIIGPGSSTLR